MRGVVELYINIRIGVGGQWLPKLKNTSLEGSTRPKTQGVDCLKKKVQKRDKKTKEITQDSKNGALESQVPPSTFNTCTIMKNIQVRMFLQKFKNSKLKPICILSWNIIQKACCTPRAKPQ